VDFYYELKAPLGQDGNVKTKKFIEECRVHRDLTDKEE